MILDFKLQANADTIRVSAPLVQIQTEVRNLVGIEGANRQIVAIGETGDEIKAKAPGFWQSHGAGIKFVRPFGFAPVDDGDNFEPLLAARIVHYYAEKAVAALKRQSSARALLGPWVDRVNYQLELDGFEQLPVTDRRDFLKRLKKTLPAVKRIQINGETVYAK